jgi:hypothetical protein
MIDPIDPLIIPLAALAIPIIVAPTSMAFKHAAKLRELDHAERMRALELGRFNPGDESWSVPLKISAGIGVGVPIVAMIAAMIASLGAGFHEGIWIPAGTVGTASVIAGACLAGESLKARARPAPEVKPAYDPDAFDVVGSRG